VTHPSGPRGALGHVNDARDLPGQRLLVQTLDDLLVGECQVAAKLLGADAGEVEPFALDLDQARLNLGPGPGDDEVEEGLRRADRSSVIGRMPASRKAGGC
jgi:hypothetical protein